MATLDNLKCLSASHTYSRKLFGFSPVIQSLLGVFMLSDFLTIPFKYLFPRNEVDFHLPARTTRGLHPLSHPCKEARSTHGGLSQWTASYLSFMSIIILNVTILLISSNWSFFRGPSHGFFSYFFNLLNATELNYNSHSIYLIESRQLDQSQLNFQGLMLTYIDKNWQFFTAPYLDSVTVSLLIISF